MRRIMYSMVAILMTISFYATAQDNLLGTNPGFDDGAAGSVTLGDQEAAGFDNGSLAPGWQFYALGGNPAGSSTFTVQEEATAPSAPNILVFSKDVASGDSAIRRDISLIPLEQGHVYKAGCWARDVDGTLNTFNFGVSQFDSTPTYLGSKNSVYATTPDWTRYEQSFGLYPTATQGAWGVRLGESTGSVQFDSVYIVDATAGDRIINGSFEDSDTLLLDWNVINVGRDFSAELIGDASEGNNAVRIFQTTTPDASDGVFSKDGYFIPWLGDHGVRLKVDVKDDPTIAEGEHLGVVMCAWSDPAAAAGSFLGCFLGANLVTSPTEYTTYTLDSTDFPPETMAISLSFRVVDADGAGIPGDLQIDNVQVYDLATLPVNEVQRWTLFE